MGSDAATATTNDPQGARPAPSLPLPAASRPFTWSLGLILLITLLAAGIGALTLYYVETQFVAGIGESLALGAGEVADKLDRLMAERCGDVQMLARAFSGRPYTVEALTAYVTWMREAYPVYQWIGVTNAKGEVIAATDPQTIGLDLSRQRWFHEAREGAAVAVGDIDTYEATGGAEAVAFTSAIRGPNGEFRGVVSTRVGIAPLEDVITHTLHTFQSQQRAYRNLEYQFMTADGRAFIDSDLSHKGNVNLFHLNLPSAIASQSSASGHVRETHLRRQTRVITGYAQTQRTRNYAGLRWAVLLRVDEADVLKPIREVLWKLAAAGVAVVFPLILSLVWSSHRLRQQWQTAQFEAARAQAAQESLQASEERATLIVETALDAVITINAKGMVLGWNSQAEDIFGWPLLAAVGQPLARLIIPPRYRQAHEQGLQHYLLTGEARILGQRLELTGQHRDGHEFPVELSVAVAGEGDRKIFNAFVRNITERKRTERRLAAQYAATKVLAEAPSMEAALPKILGAVCQSLDWHHGAIWHVDRDAKVLRFAGMWHAPTQEAKEFEAHSRVTTFEKGIGLPGRVWATCEPAWISDVTQDPNFPRAPVARKAGLRGAFAFPIRIGDDVTGVLEFFSHAKADPDSDLLRMVGAVGSQIGQFIERKRAEADLQRARNAAESANLAKSQFLTNMSHELRTPLNGILGMLHLAQTTRLSTEQQEYIGTAQSSAESLLTIMSDVLDLSKLESGQVRLVTAAFEVRGVAQQAVAGLADAASAKGLALDLSLAPDVPTWVEGDGLRLQQILTNLIGNAIKFTPQGRVDVSVNRDKPSAERGTLSIEQAARSAGSSVQHSAFIVLRFSVRDTGIGIPADKQEMIFQAFTQADGSLTRKFGGMGLGLAISKHLVEMMGGRIWLESVAGEGSAFHFSTRLTLPAMARRSDEADAFKQTDRKDIVMSETSASPTPKGPRISAPADAGIDVDAALARLEGDIELFQAIVQQGLTDAPPLLEAIREAVRRGDAEALAKAAHKLKGTVSEFAAKSAADAAQRLEAMGRLGTLEGAPQALNALDQAMERLTPALEEIVNRPRN